LRRWCSAAGLFAVVFFVTFGFLSCGGSASSRTTSSSSPPPSSGNGGSTPSGATVIDNIEDADKWLTCGACGNDGGTGSVANYSVTVGLPSPSEDGSATQFAIAASVPYTNAYFYQTHDAVNGQINFLAYEFDVYIPDGSENAPQALEFECQERLNGWTYNFAWQANYGGNTWRIFNYVAKQWDESGLSFQPFSPGTWHHIVAEYHNDVSTHSVLHDALTVDGVRFPVNIRHDAAFEGASDELSNAVQLDTNNVPTAYKILVDRMKITYK